MKACYKPNEHTSLSDRFAQSPGKGGGVSETVSESCDATLLEMVREGHSPVPS